MSYQSHPKIFFRVMYPKDLGQTTRFENMIFGIFGYEAPWPRGDDTLPQEVTRSIRTRECFEQSSSWTCDATTRLIRMIDLMNEQNVKSRASQSDWVIPQCFNYWTPSKILYDPNLFRATRVLLWKTQNERKNPSSIWKYIVLSFFNIYFFYL